MAALSGKTVALGSPQSPSHKIDPIQLADWMTEYEALAGSSGVSYIDGTLAALNARTGTSDGEYALVINDQAEAGVYERISGTWTKKADIPSIFTESLAADQAAASASAAASSASSAASSASAAAASESDAEIARTQAELAATAAGATIYDSIANGLAGTTDGDVFLVSTEPGVQVYRNDTGSETFLGWLGEILFDDVSALLASTTSFAEGALIRTRSEGFAYEVAASGASDHHVTTAGGVKLYVLAKDGALSLQAFGAVGDGVTDDTAAIQAAIDYCQSTTLTAKTIDFANGTYLVTSTLSIVGFFAFQGLTLRGDNAVLQAGSALAAPVVKVDALTNYNLRANVRFENLNIFGSSRLSNSIGILIEASTGGAYVTADVWVKDCMVRSFDIGIKADRGIILDYESVTFDNCNVGYSSNLGNSTTFSSCRFVNSSKAMLIQNFQLGVVAFNNCDIEGNASGGSVSDGVKCCEFTSAGRVTFNACHFESNNCQYNIHFTGVSGNGSSLVFIGSQVIAGLESSVHAETAYVSAIGSYIGTGANLYDIWIDSNSHATLIDNFSGNVSGPGSTEVTSIGGFLGTKLNFGNDASFLDDYQEGTWDDATLTPINASAVDMTDATYTKVGRLVTIAGRISGTLTTTATGVTVIFNLPFNTTANTSRAVGYVKHNLTIDGYGFVSDTTTGGPSQSSLRIPASQVTVANGTAFVADFTLTYETS